MRKFLHFVAAGLIGLVGLMVLAAALLAYFVYTPDPPLAQLSGTMAKGSFTFDGLNRSYQTYRPSDLPPGAPLVLVMHGSGESAADIRIGTGFGFEQLADVHRFAVVYPNAYTFDWNDCSKVGDFSVNGREVDDTGFLGALVGKLSKDIHIDPRRVFATGVSSGGFMSLRLAMESPSRIRAVAAVSANVPTEENFKCKPTGPGASVLIMNGTKDPLVPFAGGESSLWGMFYKGGTVRSSLESVQYFADLNAMTGSPKTSRTQTAGGVAFDQTLWQNDSKVEIELVAIEDGGHGMPQPYWRRPRLLGPSPMEPNGPAMIWSFFERQR